MAVRKHISDTKEADDDRSTEDIRRDIAKEKENISQAVDQIGERIQEKLEWREYVKESPYLAIGAAAGLGYLVSRAFITRTTPMERIMSSIADEVQQSLSGLRGKTSGPGLVKVTLQVFATKAAVSWIKKAISTSVANGGPESHPQAERGSTITPKADMSNKI